MSFKASLGGKFLLSYLLIVLVGVATLLVVTFALAPTLFHAQLLPILQTHPRSLTTAEASQRILGDFLGTLFVALAVAAIAATVTSLAISLFVAWWRICRNYREPRRVRFHSRHNRLRPNASSKAP
jgi:hypothetical protein